MIARRCLAAVAWLSLLSGCATDDAPQAVRSRSSDAPVLKIQLDGEDPGTSFGLLQRPEGPLRFSVGQGRHGIACAGTRFEEGVTPLGRFRVNAILSEDRFAMDPALVERSGKSEDELRRTLFRNMNSIDFKGDGETGEYGSGYISLEPVAPPDQPLNAEPLPDQPFQFNTYDGTFRWYSFAIHGSNDPSRIGQAVTGGCINAGRFTMEVLLDRVNLGDLVEISSDSPCLP